MYSTRRFQSMEFERLPEEDGDGYIVKTLPPLFLGYVYRSFINDKWAAFSQYGQAMSDHIYDTPLAAANFDNYG